MSFYDKLSANLTNAGRAASQMAKNLSDSNALQREMNTEKRNIQQKIAEIGQLYYDKFKNDPGADFFAEIEAITASERRIEELQAEIQGVQARKPDLVQVPSSAPKSSVQPSAMVCMQCGTSYSDVNQTFCSECGQKLTAQYPTSAAAYMAPSQTACDVQTRPEAVRPSLTKPADIISPAQSADAAATPSNEGENKTLPRFCPKCGAKADDDSLFCAQCGNRLG